MGRARFLVAYDGERFHGFAENDGVETVMGAFRSAVELVLRTSVELTGAGRTDAGVHAWGQVISGDLPDGLDLGGLMRRLNKLLGPRISVRDAGWADDDFDARFSALARHYRYHVWNMSAPNPLLAGQAWHVPRRLDVAAMRTGGDALLGEHDFSSFCRRPKVAAGQPQPSLVRELLSLQWTELSRDAHDGMLRLEITATAFCHQMVRSIVGTLVDVGLGRIEPGQVGPILAARDRNAAGAVAPPHGLVLWRVDYPDGFS